MKVLIGVAALLSVVVLVAGGGSVAAAGNGKPMSAPLRQQLAKVARRLGYVNSDSRPLRTARVYGPASYQAATKAWGGGTTTARRRTGRYYVIVIRGRFVCTAYCSPPPGLNGQPAPAHHYSIASRPWSPTTGNNGIGLSNKLPASMSELGRPTLITLR
jgi:hypothetical protein